MQKFFHYCLYSVGLFLAIGIAIVLSGFYATAESENHSEFMFFIGLNTGLASNLSLLLVPMAAHKGSWWRLSAATLMLPSTVFLARTSVAAVSHGLHAVVIGIYVTGLCTYMGGYGLLLYASTRPRGNPDH